MAGHWLRMRWKFFVIKWVACVRCRSWLWICVGIIGIYGLEYGSNRGRGWEGSLFPSVHWVWAAGGEGVLSASFCVHVAMSFRHSALFHSVTGNITSPLTCMMLSSTINLNLSYLGKRNFRTRIQRPTRLCPGHRLRWYSWSILRSCRVIPYWWILSRVQLSIYGGLCR